jgi:catechol 2,3-dioxygenase-like lactoylglutathione lyase family enzyme
MRACSIISQLRTTDLGRSIDFYTGKLGFQLAFRYQDFYAGIGAGGQTFHLKLVDHADPSIAFAREGGHFHLYFDVDDVHGAAAELKAKGVRLLKEAHETPWGTREMALEDPDGHTLYFGQPLK